MEKKYTSKRIDNILLKAKKLDGIGYRAIHQSLHAIVAAEKEIVRVLNGRKRPIKLKPRL